MSVARPAATAPGAGRSLVFVTSQFPEPNETFIVREIAELARMGFAITVLSLRPPPAVINPPEARALLPLVVYPPASHAKVLLEALRAFGRGPRAALLLVGDAIDQQVRWKDNANLSALAGNPIRLVFELKDADLFSIQFR